MTYVHRAVTSAPYPQQVLVRFHAPAEEVPPELAEHCAALARRFERAAR